MKASSASPLLQRNYEFCFSVWISIFLDQSFFKAQSQNLKFILKIALNFSPVLIKTIEVTWVSFRTLLTDFNELFAENNKFIFYFSAAKSDFFFLRRIFCQRILSLCC